MSTKQIGFTLIEMMITIAVLAILLSIAIPSFQTLMLDNRIAAQANQLITAFNYGRSEAVKRAAPATVCPTNGGAACAGSTNWSTGWLVFADANNNGTVDANEDILRVWPALDNGNTLNSGAKTRVTFTATGFATGFNDTFSLCDKRGVPNSRATILNAMGRAYVKKGGGTCP
ncbi:MAG: GspH/FimT family pseudopilin [Thiobacillus sp.]|nr:GspH/FimT family pseudopilin [Thiobacillus sp.]